MGPPAPRGGEARWCTGVHSLHDLHTADWYRSISGEKLVCGASNRICNVILKFACENIWGFLVKKMREALYAKAIRRHVRIGGFHT